LTSFKGKGKDSLERGRRNESKNIRVYASTQWRLEKDTFHKGAKKLLFVRTPYKDRGGGKE